MNDPLEAIIAKALRAAGFRYTRDNGFPNLDFVIYTNESTPVYIEVTRAYTPRKIEQMSRACDIILIQGEQAAKLFASIVTRINKVDTK